MVTEGTYRNGSSHGIKITIAMASVADVWLNDNGVSYGYIDFFLPTFKLKSRVDEGPGMINEIKPEDFQP